MVQFTNANTVVIRDAAGASLYPSTIQVSGLSGSILGVTVCLHGLSHSWPQDFGALLVGPQGQKIILVANAGGGQALNQVTLTFDDAAAACPNANDPIVSGRVKPGFFGAAEAFYAPAPTGPYSTSLAAFNGANPNGEWSLYLQDDQPGDGGSLNAGWSISLLLDAPQTNPATPVLSQPRLLSNGQFQFTLGGAAGSNYEIRASGDLVNWKVLRNVSLGGASSNLIDSSGSLERRYYRARLLP